MTGLVQFSVLLVLAAGQQSPDCMISCCLACTPGNECEVCYLLNKWDPISCPCVETLTGGDSTLLGTFQRLANSGSVEFEETRTGENTVEYRISQQREQRCKPLCCPTLSCNTRTCANCYNRHAAQPEKCPCLEIN